MTAFFEILGRISQYAALMEQYIEKHKMVTEEAAELLFKISKEIKKFTPEELEMYKKLVNLKQKEERSLPLKKYNKKNN